MRGSREHALVCIFVHENHPGPEHCAWWDVLLARRVRAAMKACQTTCRQGIYCETDLGGSNIPSLVVEAAAAVARELLVALDGDGLDAWRTDERQMGSLY